MGGHWVRIHVYVEACIREPGRASRGGIHTSVVNLKAHHLLLVPWTQLSNTLAILILPPPYSIWFQHPSHSGERCSFTRFQHQHLPLNRYQWDLDEKSTLLMPLRMNLGHTILLLPHQRPARRLQPGLPHQHVNAFARERRALEIPIRTNQAGMPDGLSFSPLSVYTAHCSYSWSRGELTSA